jgi:alkylation response protein AidB-like acyl-CoA dehydrogenase
LLEKAAATLGPEGFPDMGLAARAKVICAETAVKVTGDALQMHGAAGYSRDLPLERIVRDARMFTIGGGTAQVLRNQIAGDVLGMKLPQTRDGWLKAAS